MATPFPISHILTIPFTIRRYYHLPKEALCFLWYLFEKCQITFIFDVPAVSAYITQAIVNPAFPASLSHFKHFLLGFTLFISGKLSFTPSKPILPSLHSITPQTLSKTSQQTHLTLTMPIPPQPLFKTGAPSTTCLTESPTLRTDASSKNPCVLSIGWTSHKSPLISWKIL